MSQLPATYQQFQKQHAKVWRAYEKLGATAAADGPLDAKTRELIKLGMAAATRGESAVTSHTHRALEAGATVAEIEQAILLGVTTLGFPTMMTALSWVKAAIVTHTEK
jgi:4-carboxymuconolactone decarboxylase